MMKSLNYFVSFLVMLLCGGSVALAELPVGVARDWVVVFEDDFQTSALNENKWNKIPYEDFTNRNIAAWRRYQSQDEALYEFNRQGREPDGTSGRRHAGINDSSLSAANGVLTLWGKRGVYHNQSKAAGKIPADSITYACGGITTQGTFSFRYGYVEVRARFDCAWGVWPAIWMKPLDNDPWPSNGEIDIMEHLNWDDNIYQTLHFNGKPGEAYDHLDISPAPGVRAALKSVKPSAGVVDARSDWHTYGVLWEEGSISFYLDGIRVGTINGAHYQDWPFDRCEKGNEFYLLIDQQIGGSWVEGEAKRRGCAAGVSATTLAEEPAAFDIDYVRVYSSPDYLVSEP